MGSHSPTMKQIALVVVLFGIALSTSVLELREWEAWKKFHGKTYGSAEEETYRKDIWNFHLKKVLEHNSQGHSYTLAMNQFADLTNTEYRYYMLGMKRSFVNQTRDGSTYLPASHVKLPPQVDWRKEGYVTGVKNQGQCGSCWAFSATGSLEGQHFKKTGKLVSLSEQQLVDCSGAYGDHGCNGGLMDNAFKYVKGNGGLDTERCYPYEAMDDSCHFKTSCIGATCTGYVDIPSGNEGALQSSTANVGPISVAIDASHMSFQLYHSGVYDEPRCSSVELDHGVLVVGYGTYQGQDYWLVKNSWGAGWGMEGYIMMSRNKDNQCGIATSSSYPLV